MIIQTVSSLLEKTGPFDSNLIIMAKIGINQDKTPMMISDEK